MVVVCRMNRCQNDSPRALTHALNASMLATILAPAKLNLTLDVAARGSDGYHELSTLMLPVRWFDTLAFELQVGEGGLPGPIEFSLHRRNLDAAVPTDRSNLVVRALELLRERSGCELGARVELLKRIPSGAGLGGRPRTTARSIEFCSMSAWRRIRKRGSSNGPACWGRKK